MKLCKWIIIICFFVAAIEACQLSRLDKNLNWIFSQFKKTFHKKYTRGEESRRKSNFKEKVKQIIKHNLEFDLGKHKYRLGLNKYSDLSQEEFVEKFNGLRRSSDFGKGNRTKSFHKRFLSASDLPAKLDYRDKNMVTPVKDQEACGSCWAFSALAALESQMLKAGAKTVDLSEQNLVDCASSYGNYGCRGGFMTGAFEYIISKGVAAEKSYPYTAKEGNCKFRYSSVAATCSSYEEVAYGDEDALLQALVDVGPISVGLDASRSTFHSYKGGIYDDPSCSKENLDHAVLLIGYGTENGNRYWLIKNSYGTSWGEYGYARIARNRNNRCGIANQPSYPVL